MSDRPAGQSHFDVFLLYSSLELESVRPIYSALVDQGIKPYFDQEDLPPGSLWSEYEDKILSSEPIIVLFLGPKGWGPNHFRLAIQVEYRKFRIIPVILGSATEEAIRGGGNLFTDRKSLSIDGPKSDGFEHLLAEIRRLIDQGMPASPPPPDQPPDAPTSGGDVPGPIPLERILELEIATRAEGERSETDLLGFSDYAEALADLIKNEQTQKPLTIGIEAPWGMGKTKLMRLVQERLFRVDASGKEKIAIPTVWFDAWKYDKEESLWAALALEVMAQTRSRLSIWSWLKIWMRLNWRRLDHAMVARTAFNAAVYCTLFVLVIVIAYPLWNTYLGAIAILEYIKKAGLAGAAAAFLQMLYAVHKRLAIPFDEKISRYVKQPNYDERVGFIGRFQEDFKEIVEVITGSAAHPLVIFIDDLDRCSPIKAVEVLEAINLLLDSNRCVFVIGMDPKAVAASIEAKYKDVVELMKSSDDPGGLTLGQRFLEKILQIEFRLPPPSKDHMLGYVDAILGYKPPPPPAEIEAVKIQALVAKDAIAKEEEKGKSPEEAARSAPLAQFPEEVKREAKVERFAESFDSYAVVRTAVNSAAVLLGNNPRKVKRFVNSFRLQALIANRRHLLEKNVIDLELLAKWLVAETRWPELMSDILDEPGLLSRAAEARKVHAAYRKDPGPENSKLLEVATEDPRVKRLAEAEDASRVIEDLRRRAGDRLGDYLYLGRIVGEAKAKPQAAAAAV